MINVILADHERIFRVGMASALAAEDDIRIVGQPHTADQLIHGLQSFRAHVLVLSSAFLGCIDRIKRTCTGQHTAILQLEDYGEMMLTQVPPDVQGIMQRSADGATVVYCIRQLARGGRVVRLVPSNSRQNGDESVGMRVRQRLSPRELSIVSHVVQGFKNREIAIRLGTTEQSIKNALRKIFDTTGVFGRLELALFVLHHQTLVGAQVGAPANSGITSVASLQRHWEAGRKPTIH